jgi:hypothetical protein
MKQFSSVTELLFFFATTYSADRLGKIYRDGITPDQITEIKSLGCTFSGQGKTASILDKLAFEYMENLWHNKGKGVVKGSCI